MYIAEKYATHSVKLHMPFNTKHTFTGYALQSENHSTKNCSSSNSRCRRCRRRHNVTVTLGMATLTRNCQKWLKSRQEKRMRNKTKQKFRDFTWRIRVRRTCAHTRTHTYECSYKFQAQQSREQNTDEQTKISKNLNFKQIRRRVTSLEILK